MLLKNKRLLRLKAAALEKFPAIYIWGGRLASNTVMFRDERKFLAGKLESDSTLPSVLFFTCIRSGSQFIDHLIGRLYQAAGGTRLNLPKFYFHGRPAHSSDLRDAGEMSRVLVPQGFYYGALRPIEGGFDHSCYRVVSVVRDPRDVIVSFFFSLAYAHTPSDRKFIVDSIEAREKGIEWFVRQSERQAMIAEPMEFYRDHIWGSEGVFARRYETIMEDFPAFVTQLEQHVTGGAAQREAERIISEHEADAAAREKKNDEEEDLRSHRRSGASGYFKNKLSPEAVETLNQRFADILEFYGYDV